MYCIKMAQNEGRAGSCKHGTESLGSIMLGISLLAEEILDFQKELCCMELVI